MRHVIFSDVHSNWEALTVCLDYAAKSEVDKYWMLGDIVGYGANPQEVSDKIFQISDVIILGNHDQAITDDGLLDWFNEDAREAILWTREHLNQETMKRLRDLPYVRIEGNVTLTHSSPFRPDEYPYLLEWEEASKAFRAFDTSLCFIGHTHVPQIFSEKQKATSYLEEGTYQLDREDRYIACCGSVGQPRDYDKRLSFGIFDDETYTLQIVRLDYPKEEAARKIRAEGLPAFLADRLL